MRKFVIALALAAFGAGSAQAQMEGATVRIAIEGAYPPFSATSPAGELIGFDVEIAYALCAEMEANCELAAQDWDGIIPGLVANKYDAIIASMSITEERKKTVAFTGRYYSNYLRVIAAKDSDIEDFDDLSGESVGAQRATVAAQWAEDNLGRRSDVKLYDTQTAAYADLKAGRLDALLTDVYPGYNWLQGEPDYTFVGERIDIDDLIGIAVRQQDDKLRMALDAAILAIRENGVYARINAKYFPFDIY